MDILNETRQAAAKKILFLPHALSQMLRPDRMILAEEVRQVEASGEVIEDYLTDVRGHSCLIFGLGIEGRPLHLVCSPKDEYLAIITAYLPTLDEWVADFKIRRKA